MGFFDRLSQVFKGGGAPKAADAAPAPSPRSGPTEPRDGGFVGGSAEPHIGKERWPLRLIRGADGAPTLVLDTPDRTQPTYAIHESLRELISRLPTDCELGYLCRIAEGGHYNILHLIAVDVASDLDSVADDLDDAFVIARPELRFSRARIRLERKNEAGAIDDLRASLEADFDECAPLFAGLSPTGKKRVAAEYGRWVAKRALKPAWLVGVALEHWSDAHLSEVANATFRDGATEGLFELEPLLVESERRGLPAAAAIRAGLAHRKAVKDAGEAAPLLPDILARTLAVPTKENVAIYADALCESGHVYGEFLALHVKGGTASVRKAKALAKDLGHAWLGPIAALLGEVDYELGLPVGARLDFSGTRGLWLARALEHPLLPSLRRVLRKKAKKTRNTTVSSATYNQIIRYLLPLGLTELDCAEDTLDAVHEIDCRRVTHLHDVNVITARTELTSERLPGVKWVEVFVRAGTSGDTFAALIDDRYRFWSSNRPELHLAFQGGASPAEVSRLRDVAPRLSVPIASVDGAPFSTE